mmetsp:Transcript_38289/g.120884  ORF Transcript_38289/g.120884 Transcript_38289/m.120884 type:complete len:208 (+) Transcript_38289:104-727(+)
MLLICLKPSRVFCSSMAMVMGPTPPGTGVMQLATLEHPSKSQSPTSLYPRFLVASSTALIPTSMMAAPGFTQSPLTNSAMPTAATMMSASRMIFSGSGVRLCTTVTVASRRCRSMAAGMPTMLERPTTTARLPEISTPERSRSSMEPLGVQGMNLGLRPRMLSSPMLKGWKPSTSLSREMAWRMRSSLMCLGRGSCTRIPCTASSAL